MFLPLLALVCAPLGAHPHGTTYYVRVDGGPPAQCDGKTDAPAAGATGGACAWSHPLAALPPEGPRIAGGDRLVIEAGQYRVGPDPISPLPSGPDPSRPTVLVGQPGTLLVGGGRTPVVVNLGGTSNAEVSCLEITDASECVMGHGGNLRCTDDGDWASAGLTALDSSRVTLRQLEIHGMAQAGMVTARTADWRVEDVALRRNGRAGWQADGAGATTIVRTAFEWNGCGEDAMGRPVACASRAAGGWGAGLAVTGASGAWRVEDARFVRNVDGGVDLGHTGEGTVLFQRVRAEADAGVQLRARGEVTVKDSLVAGTCRAFDGGAETFHVDACAGGGAALVLEPMPGKPIALAGDSISGAGSSLLALVVPVAPGQPKDLCRKLAPVKISKTTWGPAKVRIWKECGGIEGAGPGVDERPVRP